MAEDTAVEIIGKRGPKPARARHAEAVREAEAKIAGHLPDISDNLLELALGRKQESCPYHHKTLKCPHVSKEMRVKPKPPIRLADPFISQEDEIEEIDRPCPYESKGFPANERMIVYALNRIAGTPTVAGDKQINLEFVRKVAAHVTDVFKASNELPDPDDRARSFAMGLSQMWILIGEQS